ncbi:class I SAM-dependent methyltransferase [Oryzifoliimicrobium ureilyticus]|uniref:class I SAM-dependent methyltransferase n=1 Tax=Oryzifoliimicrobium ureilyticus TaxID=3113724 RepID=UPI0030761542
MTQADKLFAGSIPAIYQRHLVPMLFEPFGAETAERVAEARPHSVLEIAAGTGVLTRALAARLAPQVKIIATDLNQPMLDKAAQLQGETRNVTFQQADALHLPFDDESFDAVVCQFGVMFFPDKLKAYREALRVLKPGGSYIFTVWDEIARNDFVAVVMATLEREFPGDPPRFMARTPHGYHDRRAMLVSVTQAGFNETSVETLHRTSHAKSALEAAIGYCQGNPMHEEIEARAPGKLQTITEKVAAALEARFGTGEITGEICAHLVTAIK